MGVTAGRGPFKIRHKSILWGKVMQTSRARILTTHTGNLPRVPASSITKVSPMRTAPR